MIPISFSHLFSVSSLFYIFTHTSSNFNWIRSHRLLNNEQFFIHTTPHCSYPHSSDNELCSIHRKPHSIVKQSPIFSPEQSVNDSLSSMGMHCLNNTPKYSLPSHIFHLLHETTTHVLCCKSHQKATMNQIQFKFLPLQCLRWLNWKVWLAFCWLVHHQDNVALFGDRREPFAEDAKPFLGSRFVDLFTIKIMSHCLEIEENHLQRTRNHSDRSYHIPHQCWILIPQSSKQGITLFRFDVGTLQCDFSMERVWNC